MTFNCIIFTANCIISAVIDEIIRKIEKLRMVLKIGAAVLHPKRQNRKKTAILEVSMFISDNKKSPAEARHGERYEETENKIYPTS